MLPSYIEEDMWFFYIYLLTAVWLTPGGSSAIHIYAKIIHKTTQLTTLVGRLPGIRTQRGQTKINEELTALKLSPNWEECGPCVFASYVLPFVLQLWKKHGKTSVRVKGEELGNVFYIPVKERRLLSFCLNIVSFASWTQTLHILLLYEIHN